MCGIVGVVGEIAHKEELALSTMLKLDTIRGPHSTGVIVVDRQGKVSYEKFLGTAYDFFDQTKLFNPRGSLKGWAKVLIGHNRWATTGKVTEENAHPFDFENVIGVHNGTLAHHSRELDGWVANEVDSAALYQTINKSGLRDAISKAHGAWSLAYYDKEEKEVVLLRNKDRPMCFRASKDHNTIFFASEMWMINVACNKHDIELDPDSHASTTPDCMYTINPNAKMSWGKGKDKKEVMEFIQYPKDLILGKPLPQSTYRPTVGVAGGTTTGGYHGGHSGRGNHNLPLFTGPSSQGSFSGDLVDKIKAKLKNTTTLEVYVPQDSKRRHFSGGRVMTYTVGDNLPVAVLGKPNSPFYKILLDATAADTFKVKKNGALYEKEKSYILSQGNSLKGPFQKSVNNVVAEKPSQETAVAVPGYKGVLLSSKEFKATLAKSSCANCSCNDPGPEEDYGKMVWITEDSYICPECMKNPDIRNTVRSMMN